MPRAAAKITAHTKGQRSDREAWLNAAVKALRPVFKTAGHPLPAVIRVSAGLPAGNARKIAGQHWAPQIAGGVHQVFINPTEAESLSVLGVLVHELAHAASPVGGHGKEFGKVARAVGLVGPLRSTEPGDELTKELRALARRLGKYPHRAVSLAGPRKKQSTRMLKAECASGSGYVVRLTRKWIENLGAPYCPCDECDNDNGNGDYPLRMLVDQTEDDGDDQ